MSEPRRLIAAAERAWAAGKPVVACKLAVGEEGAQAALSHTGSLAGADAAYRAAFDRAGVVLVENIEALIETACFFAKAPPPKARGVAVIATSGGAAIMAADKAEIHRVALPQPAAPAREILAARIPEFGSPRNPCDVTAQVLNDPESLPACCKRAPRGRRISARWWCRWSTPPPAWSRACRCSPSFRRRAASRCAACGLRNGWRGRARTETEQDPTSRCSARWTAASRHSPPGTAAPTGSRRPIRCPRPSRRRRAGRPLR